jgi:hypothetical protein
MRITSGRGGAMYSERAQGGQETLMWQGMNRSERTRGERNERSEEHIAVPVCYTTYICSTV